MELLRRPRDSWILGNSFYLLMYVHGWPENDDTLRGRIFFNKIPMYTLYCNIHTSQPWCAVNCERSMSITEVCTCCVCLWLFCLHFRSRSPSPHAVMIDIKDVHFFHSLHSAIVNYMKHWKHHSVNIWIKWSTSWNEFTTGTKLVLCNKSQLIQSQWNLQILSSIDDMLTPTTDCLYVTCGPSMEFSFTCICWGVEDHKDLGFQAGKPWHRAVA